MILRKNFCIVTPNLNMGKYLEETIQSVISNMLPGDEYYIIDGGSSDDSLDIIKKYEHIITGWVSEKDKSYSDAVSKGFDKTNLDYLCWIACGDLLLPDSLKNAYEIFSDNNPDFIYGDNIYIDNEGLIIQISNGRAYNITALMYYGNWLPLQDACFWKRSLYLKVGGLDGDLRYAADYDFFLKMSIAGKSLYAPFVFSAFRKHSGQISMKHQNSYRNEQKASRKRVLNFKYNIIDHIKYYLYARIRARIHTMKYSNSYILGKSYKYVCSVKTKFYS